MTVSADVEITTYDERANQLVPTHDVMSIRLFAYGNLGEFASMTVGSERIVVRADELSRALAMCRWINEGDHLTEKHVHDGRRAL